MMTLGELEKKCRAAGQEHLLRFWNELDDANRAELAGQLEALDFDTLGDLIKEYVLTRPRTAVPDDLGPAPFFPLAPRSDEDAALYARAKVRGEELLRAGKVAALTVAGGQGTRLGFDGPKGTYPIGPVSGKPLFQYFAESLLRAGAKYGKPVTWYIMTSTLNCEATKTFFADNDYFGLAPEQVFFFIQGTMPAIDYDGKLLLGAKSSLSLSPDGHGGTLLALRKSGALDRMRHEDTTVISYFQVDNPLVPVVNPFFIGMHDLTRSQMSAIMLAKTGPFEKLGNFCVSDGRLQIIEYSDLPAELAESRNPDGTLRFIAGSPAIHLLDRDFVAELTAGGSLKLPWHRADKKVPYVNERGELVTPAAPNAVKLESFIFDALPLAGRTMVLEGAREAMFAPTKNPTGVDSVESCRAMLMERDARWLEKARVRVARHSDGTLAAAIEFSPLVAIDEEDAKAYVAECGMISVCAGATLYLEP